MTRSSGQINLGWVMLIVLLSIFDFDSLGCNLISVVRIIIYLLLVLYEQLEYDMKVLFTAPPTGQGFEIRDKI